MITYVNTVLVSTKESPALKSIDDITGENGATGAAVGDFVWQNLSESKDFDFQSGLSEFRIGMIVAINTVLCPDGGTKDVADVKWSNEIKASNIKSFHVIDRTGAKSTEDKVEIDFTGAPMIGAAAAHDGGYNVVLRLTFKDLPTRYRNWTESYNYITKPGDTATEVAAGLALAVNKAVKRARVSAKANTATKKITGLEDGKLYLEALPYTDDDAANTINWAGKVRFNANVWFTDPNAPAFMSNNKYSAVADSSKIVKTVGEDYVGKGKIVRDHEAIAMGYQGILNQGQCTWPIIKPNLFADNSKDYSVATLEFENMYRAADDIFRKTKQTVEIYVPGSVDSIASKIETLAGISRQEGYRAPKASEPAESENEMP